MERANLLFLVLAYVFLQGGAEADAQASVTCRSLGANDLSSVLDAPAQILQSLTVPATEDQPELCHVRGTVAPNTGFEMFLPTTGWNTKFLQAGCAGFCGRTMAWACQDATRRGYACIVSDMGHRSALESRTAPSLSALWASDDESAQIDHGFRAVHTTTLIGKEIVQRFYGRAPQRSYFNGCSEGGREGLVAAQRFPYDFDGIIAGAPLIDTGRTFLTTLWNAKALRDQSGKPTMNAAAAARISAAVLKQCDLNDGIIDGVIGDPRRCHFDPRSIICASGADRDCLQAKEAEAVAAILAGPSTSTGVAIGRGGLSPGISWMRLLAPGTAGRTVPESYGEEFFRYMGFWPAPGSGWSLDEFNFDRDYRRTGVADALLSATNPDLRTFKARGGKLLLYHGWDDHLIAPGQTVDYYETVRATMGGQVEVDPFMRLFMAPGMDHCALGNGAWAIDFLSYLENWIERGEAPDAITGIRPRLPADPAKALERIGRFPVPVHEIEYMRPIFRFPFTPRYAGQGDPARADNYELLR